MIQYENKENTFWLTMNLLSNDGVIVIYAKSRSEITSIILCFCSHYLMLLYLFLWKDSNTKVFQEVGHSQKKVC